MLPRVALVPAIDATPAPVVEDRFLDLHFDQFALFLDDDDQIEPFGEFVEAVHVQRPGLRDLVGGDAQTLRLGLADPQKRQRMHEVEPVLAGGDETDLGAGMAPDAAVDTVRAGECLGGEAFVVDHPRFLHDPVIDEPDVQTAVGHHEVLGRDKVHPVRATVHDRGRFHRVLHQFQPGPQPRKPAECIAIDAEIENLLNASRRQHGHIGVDHRPVGLVQNRRAFAGVVVAHRHQNAAVFRRSRHVGMAHNVAGAIDAGPFAVPKAEHAVMGALAAQFGLLRTPQRSGREILVQPRLEHHTRIGQIAPPLHHPAVFRPAALSRAA